MWMWMKSQSWKKISKDSESLLVLKFMEWFIWSDCMQRSSWKLDLWMPNNRQKKKKAYLRGTCIWRNTNYKTNFHFTSETANKLLQWGGQIFSVLTPQFSKAATGGRTVGSLRQLRLQSVGLNEQWFIGAAQSSSGDSQVKQRQRVENLPGDVFQVVWCQVPVKEREHRCDFINTLTQYESVLCWPCMWSPVNPKKNIWANSCQKMENDIL